MMLKTKEMYVKLKTEINKNNQNLKFNHLANLMVFFKEILKKTICEISYFFLYKPHTYV